VISEMKKLALVALVNRLLTIAIVLAMITVI
jgi:hypothetical protein